MCSSIFLPVHWKISNLLNCELMSEMFIMCKKMSAKFNLEPTNNMLLTLKKVLDVRVESFKILPQWEGLGSLQ